MADVSELLRNATSEPSILEPSAQAPGPAQVPIATPEQFPELYKAPSLPEQKKASVAATSDAKRIALGGSASPETIASAAVARRTGAGLSSANPVESDLARLSYNEIEAKYGEDTAASLAMETARMGGRATVGYSGSDFLKDAGVGVVSALGRIGGSMNTTALGLINPEWGEASARSSERGTKFVEGFHQPSGEVRGDATRAEATLDARDVDHAYEKSDKGVMDVLAREGKHALNAAEDVVTNPEAASRVTGQAVGSIGAAAAMSAVVGPMAALGIIEGTGAYTDTTLKVAKTSHEDLLKISPSYRQMVENGVDPDTARAYVARNAALPAGALAGAGGMLAGKFTEGFVRNPFKASSVGAALTNIGKEPIEEGLQGIVSQGAQNIGVRMHANETQDLAEGTGRALGEGAVGGILGAGVMQSPALAGNTVAAAGRAAVDYVGGRADAVMARNEAASPVSEQNIRTTAAEVTAQVSTPEAMQSIAEAVNATPEESRPAAESLADRIVSIGQFDPADVSTVGLSEDLQSTLGSATDRVSAMYAMANEVQQLGPTNPQGLAAARELSKQLTDYYALVESDARAFEAIPDDHPAGILNERVNQLADAIVSSPTVKGALDAIASLTPEQINELIQPVTADSLNTPEGTQNAENALAIAELVPEKANPAVSEQLLKHAEEGRLTLTPEQRQSLMASVAITRAATKAVERHKALGHAEPINDVSNDVFSKETRAKDDRKRSAKDFVRRVSMSMKAGNIPAARAELEDFGHFVTHMANKSAAVNQHYEQGGGAAVSFQARNSADNTFYATKGKQMQSMEPKSPKSVEYAQRVNIEATMLADIFNGLVDAFPALQMEKKVVAPLNANLQGTPKDVAQAHRNGERSPNKVPEPTVAVQEAPAKPVDVQPKAETNTKVEPAPAQETKADASLPGSSKAKPATKDIPYRSVSWDQSANNGRGAKVESTGSAPVIDYSGRKIVIADVNGVSVPFYLSTGRGGKADVTSGKWYPFFGIGTDGWINKTSGKEITSYYGSPALQQTAEMLDRTLGDIRDDQSIPKVPGTGAHMDAINSAFSAVTENGTPETANIVRKNIADIVQRVDGSPVAEAVTAAEPVSAAQVTREEAKAPAPAAAPTQTYKKFARNSETLGLPREDMPQIRSADHGAMVNFLNARGIAHETKQVDPTTLLPTQAEFSPESVQRQVEKGTGGRSIVVSQDGRILDGHHQWLAALETGNMVPVIELKTDVYTALNAMHEFPSSRTDDTSAPAQPKKIRSIVQAFPRLVRASGKNWFQEAFSVPAKVRSLLLGTASPMRTAQQLVSEMDKVPDHVKDAYSDYLKMVPRIVDAMEKRLQDKLKQKNVAESLRSSNAVSWTGTRVFNLLEEQPDGSFRYNRALAEQSVIAGLHWALNMDNYRSEMDADQVSSLTGLQDGDAEVAVDILDKGLSPLEAVRSLSARIQDFWGLKKNDDAGIGHTDGIPQAMAAELLAVLSGPLVDGEGLINVERFAVSNGEVTPLTEGTNKGKSGVREVHRIVPNMTRFDARSGQVDPLFQQPAVLEKAVLTERVDATFYEGDEIPVAKTQMNNPEVENTTYQRKMIEVSQKQPYRMSDRMVRLYSAIGADGLLNLFGGGADLNDRIKNGTINQNHAKTLAGRNSTMMSAWVALQARVAEMQDTFGDLSKPIHYKFNVSSVGRLQMLGGQTPQLSKLVREAILPTWSKLDLVNNESHQHFFRLAVAQGLGIKVHAQDTQTINAKLDDLVSKLPQSVEMLKKFAKSDKADLPDGFEKMLRAEFAAAKADLTPVALHVLTEYARFEQASEADRASFETAVYIEADGVTNGAANAIRMLSAGHFTPEQLTNMARTGQFFTDSTTMNEHRAKDSVDLYQATSAKAQKNIISFLGANEHLIGQMQNALRVLSSLVPGINVDLDNIAATLQLDRGVVKNPMTMMLYGASPSAVATKLADMMIRALYEKVSGIMQNGSEGTGLFMDDSQPQTDAFVKAFNGLLGEVVVKDRRDLILTASNMGVLNISNPATFTITPAQRQQIEQNLLHLMVFPLKAAIEDTMGDTATASSKMVQQATNVQSILFAHTYKTRLDALLAGKKAADPSWNANTGPSRKELSQLFRSVLKDFPLVATGLQSFLPIKTGLTGMRSLTSSGLFDEFQTEAETHMPQAAGVKGSPMLNIGMGDGMMIQYMLSVLNTAGLPVFDGFNLSIENAAKGGLDANKAAAEAWKGNSLRAVLDSYAVFMERMDTSMLKDPAVLEQVAAAFLPEYKRSSATAQSMLETMKGLEAQLREGAKMVDARNKVVQEHQHFVDQMAALQTPHKNEGIVLEGDYSQQADALNARLNEVLRDKPVEAAAPAPFSRDFSDIAARLNPAQKAVWNRLNQASALAGYTVELFSKHPALNERTNGVIDIAGRTIHLRDDNAETLLHEAVHAGTYEAVLAHYEGRDLGPRANEVKGAINRLEELLEQFLGLDIDEMVSVAPAYVDAVRAISDSLEQGGPAGRAAALNEFMAWTLSNANLAAATKKVPSLVQLAKDVWQQISRIVFGRSFAPKTGQDMFSNILFNSAIVMREQPNIASMAVDGMLHQDRVYGANDRISALNEQFTAMFAKHFDTDQVAKTRRGVELVTAQVDVAEASRLAVANGFSMDAQSLNVFNSMVAAFAVLKELDPTSLAKMEQLYRHVTSNITPSDLIDKTDPDQFRAEAMAQNRYNMLLGNFGTRMDAKGRSSLLPVFMGLAMVDESLRAVMEQMDLPKNARKEDGSLTAQITNAAASGLDLMSERLTGLQGTKNVTDALDRLINTMIRSTLDTQSAMEQALMAPNGMMDRVNTGLVNRVERTVDSVIGKARKVRNSTDNSFVVHAAQVSEFLAGMLTTKHGEHQAEGLLRASARMSKFGPLSDLVTTMVGLTKSNAPVYLLIKKAASMVGQTRQKFREELPGLLAKQFSRKVSKAEWSAMHMALGKTGASLLANHFSNAETLEMIGNRQARTRAMRQLEGTLKSLDGAHYDLLMGKIDQLAGYMTGGKAGTNLLRNGEAIANLFNEKKDAKRPAPSADLVKTVEQLVALSALGKVNQEAQDLVSSLVRTEAKGMDFMLSYVKGLRNDEMAKATGLARFNAFEGYIPEHQQAGLSLIVMNDQEAASLLAKGYVRVGDYKGSKAEGTFKSRGYYFAPVSSRAAFSQGIMQNAASTAGGVELASGSIVGPTAGRITSPALVAKITANLAREGDISENLIPVFDQNGKVIAYDRALDPAQLARLKPDTDMGRMMGAWHGRQVEEVIGIQLNRALIQATDKVYRNASAEAKKSEFVDLLDPETYRNDPVIKDAVSLLTVETRQLIKEELGDKFMVRRDMVADAVGYRKATVGDAWTGNTRWSPETQRAVQRMAMGLFGNKAYSGLVNAEAILQEGVAIAKTTIVVRSVIVPIANFASGILQLTARGVPLLTTMRALPKKIAEAEAYSKGRLELMDLEGQLRVAEANREANAQLKLKAKIQSIEDGFRRLSIWPLIEAGEFGAVSQVDMRRDDMHLVQGRLHEYISNIVDKMPESAKTAARYGFIAQDTPLFRGLSKAVQYGDFMAKAIFYDHLVNTKKVDQQAALEKITDEFINYDRLPGRSRGYVESMGLLWFMNFKLRSAKVALSMLRENPLQALISSAMPMPNIPGMTMGTPIGDNVFSKALDGTLGYAIGPGMMFNAPSLHPVGQVLGKI